MDNTIGKDISWKEMHLSGFDHLSSTYISGDNVIHAVSGAKREVLLELWNSGCLQRAADLNLIYPTSFGNDNGTILSLNQEQGKIIYPAEWTFEMVRLAALSFIDLNNLLDEEGFGLVDAHPYNFVFQNGFPKWVDLGSIVRKSARSEYLFPEIEFFQTYLIPLRFAQQGKINLARLILKLERHNDLNKVDLVSKFKRIMFSQKLDKYIDFFTGPIVLNSSSLIKHFLSSSLAPRLARSRIRRIKKRLERLDIRSVPTLWDDYDDDFILTDRFKKINLILQNLPGKNVLDIGGNTGAFASKFLATSKKDMSYCVLDSDLKSLEKGFSRVEVVEGRLHFAYFDFAQPWMSANSKPYWERFHSDLVIMLAVTHHLVLTERMTFLQIFERLQLLTHGYLLIEFMPLGLWHSEISANEIPANYTEEDFVSAMSKFFSVTQRIELEPNRILFVGKAHS